MAFKAIILASTLLAFTSAIPPKSVENDHLNAIDSYSSKADPGAVLSFGRLDNDDFPANLPDGHICMDKVVMVDETVYDEEMRCHHMYTESCHQKYETVFKKAQYKKCQDTFKKSCFYEYKKIPHQHTVEICNDNLRRNCSSTDGEEVCTTEYVMVCESAYSDGRVTDDVPNCRIEYTPICNDAGCRDVPVQRCVINDKENAKLSKTTECKSVPRQVCGPEACPIVEGPQICRNEIKTVVQEVPEETCQMVPRKDCKMETQIIPSLEPREECVDVPKEICATVRVNPRSVSTPVLKKWCGPAEMVGANADDNGGESRAAVPETPKRTSELPSFPTHFLGLQQAIGGNFFVGQQKVGSDQPGVSNKKPVNFAQEEDFLVAPSVTRGSSRMHHFQQ